MTQEEKEILLKDLCARLPYRVIVMQDDGVTQRTETAISVYTDSIGSSVYLNTVRHIGFPIEEIKPYLRQMSSMTEEEKKYMEELSAFKCTPDKAQMKIDFYLKNHIDYRGLIKKGLALEAPEEMYK